MTKFRAWTKEEFLKNNHLRFRRKVDNPSGTLDSHFNGYETDYYFDGGWVTPEILFLRYELYDLNTGETSPCGVIDEE